MKSPVSILLAIVCGALFFMYVSEKCSSPLPPVVIDTALVNQNARFAAQRKADSVEKIKADSIAAALQVLAQQQANRAIRAERSAASLKARADSLNSELASAQSAPDSTALREAAFAAERQRGDSVEAALDHERQSHAATKAILASAQTRIFALEIRNDSLFRNGQKWETEAQRTARIANERGRQRFPSKAEAFFFGVIIGAAGVVAAASAGG